LGISPNGAVTFVSSLFPGSTSDKIITLKSGLLDQLVPGDLILADRGFLIRDIILPPGVSLNIFFSPKMSSTCHCIHEHFTANSAEKILLKALLM